MDETPTTAVDAIVRDAANDRKSKGLLPEVRQLRDFISPIVERLDRKTSENRLRVKPKPVPIESQSSRSESAFLREYERRIRAHGEEPSDISGWTITRKPLDAAKERAKELAALNVVPKLKELLIKRFRLLRAHPSWKHRFERVNPLAAAGHLGPEKREAAAAIYRSILEDSCKTFGAWQRETPKPLWFSGQQNRGGIIG